MATESELDLMLQWLESKQLASPKRREVTLSYLQIVFGACTADELRAACQYLQRNPPVPWIVLRRIVLEGSAQEVSQKQRTAS